MCNCCIGLSTFESAREEMLQYAGFTMDVIHCCDLELATLAVDGALQTIAELAASSKLQDALLKTGVMWLVFNFRDACMWFLTLSDDNPN